MRSKNWKPIDLLISHCSEFERLKNHPLTTYSDGGKAKTLKGNYEDTSKLKIPEGWGD